MAMTEYVQGEIPKRDMTEGELIIAQLIAVSMVAEITDGKLKTDELVILMDRTIRYINATEKLLYESGAIEGLKIDKDDGSGVGQAFSPD